MGSNYSRSFLVYSSCRFKKWWTMLQNPKFKSWSLFLNTKQFPQIVEILPELFFSNKNQKWWKVKVEDRTGITKIFRLVASRLHTVTTHVKFMETIINVNHGTRAINISYFRPVVELVLSQTYVLVTWYT